MRLDPRPGTAILLLIALLALPAARSAGQAVLQSEPPGAHMAMGGEVSLAGTGALPLTGLPAGDYRFSAAGPGLPAVKGRLVRTEGGWQGRPWAGPGAFSMPPGFVQLERGERRGWTLLAAGVGSGTMAVISQAKVGDAKDERDRAELDYRWAVAEEAIEQAAWNLRAASQERDDRAEIRNLWTGYFALTWLGAGVEAVFLTPQPSLRLSDPDRYTAVLPRAGGLPAALRSALIPGGGQRYMGRDGRAGFFFTATAALAAATIVAQEAFLEARRDQAAAQHGFDIAEQPGEIDAARRKLERAAEKADDRNVLRWALAGATAGIYAWNVLDAARLGRQGEPSALTLSLSPGPEGAMICASWSIR
jgi:hypothetical protein